MLVVNIVLLFCWQLGRFENDLLQNALHAFIVLNGANIFAVLISIVNGYYLLLGRYIFDVLILGERSGRALLVYLTRRRLFL